MGPIEATKSVLIHYAGAPNQKAAGPSEYKLAQLPKLSVTGSLELGFSVKGFQAPRGTVIKAFLGKVLAEAIGPWPEAEQARAIHNLITFMEAKKPRIWDVNRGIQEAITDLLGYHSQVKIGFDTRGSFDPEHQPQATVRFGVDLDICTSESRHGQVDEVSGGIANIRYIVCGTILPAQDLLAILRFQG